MPMLNMARYWRLGGDLGWVVLEGGTINKGLMNKYKTLKRRQGKVLNPVEQNADSEVLGVCGVS